MKHILVRSFITAITALLVGSALPPQPPIPPVIPGEPGIETERGGTCDPQDDESPKKLETED